MESLEHLPGEDEVQESAEQEMITLAEQRKRIDVERAQIKVR